MVRYRFTVTTIYTNGETDTYECDYVYEAYDKLAQIEYLNDHWHDVASVVIHDSKYGTDDVYEFEEVA